MTLTARGPLIPRWVIRRLYAPFKPDVEQELRVQRYLYGRRTQVSLVEKPHVYQPLEGTNLVAMDRASHERLHRGESPHPYP